MKELSWDEALQTSGGHEHDESCDGHDHDHPTQPEQHAPRAYHFDFSDWF